MTAVVARKPRDDRCWVMLHDRPFAVLWRIGATGRIEPYWISGTGAGAGIGDVGMDGRQFTQGVATGAHCGTSITEAGALAGPE